MSDIERIFVMMGNDKNDNLIFENSLIYGNEPTHGGIKYLATPYILVSTFDEELTRYKLMCEKLAGALETIKNHADGLISKRTRETDEKERHILQLYCEATCSGKIISERALSEYAKMKAEGL